MTRLLFTCAVLIVALCAVQFTIWSPKTALANESVKPKKVEYERVGHYPTQEKRMIYIENSRGEWVIVEIDENNPLRHN